MAWQCKGCGKDKDYPHGVCPECRRRIFGSYTWFSCVMCRAPFPKGRPHKRCMARYGRNAAKGLPLPSYWRRRGDPRGKGKFLW